MFVLPDEELFPRQRSQMSQENKFVPDEVIANLKGESLVPKLAVQSLLTVLPADTQGEIQLLRLTNSWAVGLSA